MAETELFFVDIPLAGAPHRLAGYRWGKEHSEIVLCVHGLSRNAHDFDFLCNALQDKYQLLCPDMPGRGNSEWLNPAFYNYQTYLFDLQCLLHAEGITRVHWIGTSMGGILGMMAAGAMPGMIQSLVLNDVGCVVAKEGLRRILSYVGTDMRFNSRAEAEATLRRICASFGIQDESHWQHVFTHSIRQASDGKFEYTYDPNITAGLVVEDMVQDINLWPLWEPVKLIPTLLIRGAESDILTKETTEMMVLTHPDLVVHEVAHTGHAPMLMAAEQINLIREWLKEKG